MGWGIMICWSPAVKQVPCINRVYNMHKVPCNLMENLSEQVITHMACFEIHFNNSNYQLVPGNQISLQNSPHLEAIAAFSMPIYNHFHVCIDMSIIMRIMYPLSWYNTTVVLYTVWLATTGIQCLLWFYSSCLVVIHLISFLNYVYCAYFRFQFRDPSM